MAAFFEIVDKHISFNKKYGVKEEVNQCIAIEQIKMKCKKIRKLPSKNGQKWAMPLEIIEKIAIFHTDEMNSYQDCSGTLTLPGLELHFLVRNMKLDDMSFITVDGIAGYIGLSANHLDGWHIGTPNSAISKPLIEAMQLLCND